MSAQASLIESLYEAALDPARWTETLAALAHTVDARACHFFAVDPESGRPLFSYLGGDNDAETHRVYLEHYAAVDPRLRIEQPAGRIIACHRHFDERFVAKDETYQDFLIPRGYRFTAWTQLPVTSDGTLAPVGFHRAPVQGPFARKTLRLIQEQFLPHLARAARVHLAFLRASQREVMLGEAIDRPEFAVLLAERTGRVLVANSAAEQLLARAEVLVAKNNRFTARHPENANAIARLLAAPEGGECTMRRPPPGSPLWVTALPLAPTVAAGMGHAAATVILFITEARRALPQQWLERRFGLTPAEARLAVNLAAGKTIGSIAAEHSIAENTLRVQVQALFRKTGVARQAELVSLLLALPAVAPPRD